ncbi:MAG: energy transducer TonB [Acidobacteriota bacterium]|nr:energy transducer TonB [Acidobacteriota bacterium]
MASLSIPLPRKIPDDQFIGDLMNLFERRKMKCGDESSLESFASRLESNDALKSDLFTLCTAISHMSAQDLTGEELLVLVAKALCGPGVGKAAAPPEIPASMRRAFLEGYEAWGARAAFAIEQPLVWPPPREAEIREEAEVGEPTDPAEGSRTIQEALEIARERSPNGMLPRANAPVPNIEHLTIHELKRLREDIEHRVSRIEPQVQGLGDAAGRVEAADGEQGWRRAVSLLESGTRTAYPAQAGGSKFEAAAVSVAAVRVEPEASLSQIEQETGLQGTESPTGPLEFLVGYSHGASLSGTPSKVLSLLPLAGLLLIASAWGGIYVYRMVHAKSSQSFSNVKPKAAPGVNPAPSAPVSAAPAMGGGVRKFQPADRGTGEVGSAKGSKGQVAAEAAAELAVSLTREQTRDADQPPAGNAIQGILPVHVRSAGAGSSTTIIGYATKPGHMEQPIGVSGTVMVEVLISKQGTVTDARVVSGPPELGPAAVQTVQRWRFKPTVVDGVPTEVTTTLGVYFKGE